MNGLYAEIGRYKSLQEQPKKSNIKLFDTEHVFSIEEFLEYVFADKDKPFLDYLVHTLNVTVNDFKSLLRKEDILNDNVIRVRYEEMKNVVENNRKLLIAFVSVISVYKNSLRNLYYSSGRVGKSLAPIEDIGFDTFFYDIILELLLKKTVVEKKNFKKDIYAIIERKYSHYQYSDFKFDVLSDILIQLFRTNELYSTAVRMSTVSLANLLNADDTDDVKLLFYQIIDTRLLKILLLFNQKSTVMT